MQSGALACKMYGWWRTLNPRSSTYDLKDNTEDQVYTPGSETTAATQAINAVGGIGFDREDDIIFKAHHWQGSYGEGRTGPPPDYSSMTGWMWQRGADYWADNGKGYTYMVHYYYDNSDSTNDKMAHFFYY